MPALIPRVLLHDRVEHLAHLGDTAMGPSDTAAGYGTVLPARVRQGENRRKNEAGEVFVSTAEVTLAAEVAVNDWLVFGADTWRVRAVKVVMGPHGPYAWTAVCGE